jgi:Arc/MetJ family transcription regulator
MTDEHHDLAPELDDLSVAYARLRTDLASVRAALEQAQRAVEAERAARRNAEADNEKLRWALEGTTRMMAEWSDNNARGLRWMRNIVAANQKVLFSPHPGAQLAAELNAARAVVWAAREADFTTVALGLALRNYDQVVKAREE